MTEPSFTALHAFHRTVAAMMADPEITGDLLLVGVWLARAHHLHQPPPGEGRWSFKAIARDLYGRGNPYTITFMGVTTRVASHHISRVTKALTDDVPRYDPMRDNERLWHPFGGYNCAAPMIRRQGQCGQHATKDHHLTDTSTGRVHVLAACHRHHAWLDEQLLHNREEVRAAGEHLPKPALNTGGALAHHLPHMNWRRIWTGLRPNWTPPPEGSPTRKPRLEVLTFEPDDSDVHPEPAGAPTLTVVKGGWQ